MAFAVATVFFRTHLKKHDLNDGNKYLGLTFQALVRQLPYLSYDNLHAAPCGKFGSAPGRQ